MLIFNLLLPIFIPAFINLQVLSFLNVSTEFFILLLLNSLIFHLYFTSHFGHFLFLNLVIIIDDLIIQNFLFSAFYSFLAIYSQISPLRSNYAPMIFTQFFYLFFPYFTYRELISKFSCYSI